jgi:AcrR family transcriptional regulator
VTRRSNAQGRRTVAAVEEAALDLAKDLPFEEITVALICRRAGISERVFFNHFVVREDAFLGRDRPHVDEAWAAQYISNPSIPLITGAARLINLPAVEASTRQLRTELTAGNPALLSRAYTILIPVREECVQLVAQALETRNPRLTVNGRAAAARVIVGAASELIQASDGDLAATADALSGLRSQLL